MIKITCILIRNFVVGFIFLFTALITHTYASFICDEYVPKDEAYYDCRCVEKNCIFIGSNMVGSKNSSPAGVLTDAILTNSAVVANEVRASRLKTINSIQEMQKEVINLSAVLANYYQHHFVVMQKLMLERINAIAKDPSWSQESYEALRLRLIKDLSDVFESKHE